MVLLNNKSFMSEFVRSVLQLVSTWTICLRGFCVPEEDTCDGLTIIEKHVSHTEILKELNSHKNGMCLLLRKGKESGIMAFWNTFISWCVSRVQADALRKSEHICTFLHLHTTLWIVFVTQSVWWRKYTFEDFYDGESDKAYRNGILILWKKIKKEKHENSSWVVKKRVGMENTKNEKCSWIFL